ncbi:MAG: methionyl-tRNA formyltransferase [Gemmatimonadota bacterium]|nr:MAG: methionyl-tRNA formyltransferase [Gemmatimonadota bacterium]
MRLAFFGTPEFAVPSLRALVEEGFDVEVVITQPDRAKGRHRSKLMPPPVKTEALGLGVPVLQPERPTDLGFLDELRDVRPALGIVVGYGHILKPALLELPAKGMINVHASLLPHLRGAAPIEHAILNGDEETGVTIMQMDAGLDTGPIVHQVATPIAPDETGGELTQRLAEIGALALVEALALIETGVARFVPQKDSDSTFAPKLTPEMARINWPDPAQKIARLVRALDPRVGARTSLGDREVKLFGPRLADEWAEDEQPGEILETDPAFVVATGSGALQFLDVQPSGRQRMAASAWLRGKNAKKGDRFV